MPAVVSRALEAGVPYFQSVQVCAGMNGLFSMLQSL